MPAPTKDAGESDPPRPSVGVTPSSAGPMNPPLTTTRFPASPRHVLSQPAQVLAETGAASPVRQRYYLAALARGEVAQVVKLLYIILALALDCGRSDR